MPSMPEPASATAIGTPNSSASTSTSRGSATIMTGLSRRTLGGRRFFPEQIRGAAVYARQVGEHEQGQRQKSERDDGVGRPDQDRQRAQLGVVVQAAPRLLRGRDQDDHAEGQRDQMGEMVGKLLQRRRQPVDQEGHPD